MKRFTILCVILLILSGGNGIAQTVSNFRFKQIAFKADTIAIDSVSLIPGSVLISTTDTSIGNNNFFIDFVNSKICWKPSTKAKPDSLNIQYKVFPLMFSKSKQIRDKQLLLEPTLNSKNPFYVEQISNTSNVFGLDGLTRSGSISRGISVGNNQDAVVNSSLNLQLSGKLAGNIEVLAAITDDNVPIQAEGNTQQLQEFDKVFIQLNNDKHKLIAGYYDIKNPDSYFMKYFKKAQGGLYSFNSKVPLRNNENATLMVNVGAAVSRGKFARNVFVGTESNQGPYRLIGAENETFIVILSGSEKIFIDGILLDRGQDRDYIIDYNTGEVIFTTRRIITKDLRITVEFQYSDKNYSRTLLTSDAQWSQKKWKAGVNFYSEQDSKNQPVQQDLSKEDKALLASVGDSLSKAFAQNIDSVAYNVNEILYARRDTTVNGTTYSPVYVYSRSADSAFFRLGFTNVGQGNGNYVLSNGAENGKVYVWVSPLNGILQGNYEPQVQLISPKRRLMATANFQYALDAKSKFGIELATTRNDVNLFSSLDKSNDIGGAAKLNFETQRKLTFDSISPLILVTNFHAELTNENFVPVEVYRPVEFTRDWNTNTINEVRNEIIPTITIGLRKASKGELNYIFKSYLREDQYTGLMNMLNGYYKRNKLNLRGDVSYLTTSGTASSTTFLRHKEEFSRRISTWIPGIRFEQERNQIKQPNSDSLLSTSFDFKIAEFFIQRVDTVKVPMKISIIRRYDSGIKNNEFVTSTIADMASFSSSFATKRGRIGGQFNYRNLAVLEPSLIAVESGESYSGRIEYVTNALKNMVQFNSYYEAGTGQEPKRNYSYLEVAPGTGVYTWNDYNDDGAQQLNEFEISNFQDQANYIRIFTPSTENVKVFFNQFNAVVNVNPAVYYKGTGDRPLWTKFSSLSTIRFDNRITNAPDVDGLNPFPRSIDDTLLLSAQTSSRHILYFNRSNPLFNSDASYQQQQSRQLLSNGVESKNNRIVSMNVRWTLNRSYGFETTFENGTLSNRSEAFQTRDFTINSNKVIQKFNLQPGATWRVTFNYRNELKKNIFVENLGEKATVNDAGVEWKFSSIKQGIISAKFNYIVIDYNGSSTTPLAYEMLEGLKIGSNTTWGLSIQRNLGSSLQLSLTYDGRKPAGLNVIHTGSAQVRAFF